MKRFIFALAAIVLCIVTAVFCVKTVKSEIQPIKESVEAALSSFTADDHSKSIMHVQKAVAHFESSENKLTLFIGTENSDTLKKNLGILLKLSKQRNKALFCEKAEECLEEIKNIEEKQKINLVNIF